MAPVVVALAAENDLAVPLIAVHMFVFYFGLMADVSPPVGLAAYAAAAIAGADPMRVGWQGTWYEFRTVLLPFIFIFNPQILLIDTGGLANLAIVVVCAIFAMMAFVAALQGFFLTRTRWYETIALLLISFTLFRPNYWMDMVMAPFERRPAAELDRTISATQGAGALRLHVGTEDIQGDAIVKTVRLTLGADGDPQKRLAATGLTLSRINDQIAVQAVRPGSEAARFKLRPGDRIEGVSAPAMRPNPFFFAIPAFVLLGLVTILQLRRRSRERTRATHVAMSPAPG
jgi:hypothetical protein